MKLLKQKSTLLPELKFKNVVKFDDKQNTCRFYHKSKINLMKKEINENNDNKLIKEKNRISNDFQLNKRSMSTNNFERESKNIDKLKEEIEMLKFQLDEEKIKSEVLHEIAEEEKKKHNLYKQKFQKLIFSNGERLEEIKDNNNNNNKITLLHKTENSNINLIKNINICNSVRNYKYKNNNSELNNFLLSQRQDHNSPMNTLPIHRKKKLINKEIFNKKINFKNINKAEDEIIDLKEKNDNKDKLIEELTQIIKELKQENNKLLNDKKIIEQDNIKLKDEINFKNKKIEIINKKLNNEYNNNQNYINKLKEVKDINRKLINKLKNKKEQNKKLKIKLKMNKSIERVQNIKELKRIHDRNEDKYDSNVKIENNNIFLLNNSLGENSKPSIKFNALNNDFSKISSIEKNQQYDPFEQDDITLNDILLKNFFNTVENKNNKQENNL